MFRWISGLFCRDVGIDLGTANVVTYVKGQGIVGNEPSVVALKRTGQKGQEKIIAVGTAAKAMIGKTPHGVETVRPLQHGVIADYDMTEAMISHFLRLANGGRSQFAHPRVVICVPACVTEVERRAVIDATLGAGAREAYVVEEPVAAAIGAGLPIAEPRGNMVVDIGGGTSEVAVLSLGGIVVHEALRSAGDEMDQAIIAMLRQNYTLHVGEVTAEEIKICIGSAMPYEGEIEEMEVKGRDLMDGLPKAVRIRSAEVRDALNPSVSRIEDMIRDSLEETPPELARDIVDQGLVLTGGGAQLRGLAVYLQENLKIPVITAERPLFSVALGVGKILEDIDAMKKVLISVDKGMQ